jgi:hypothetical protein
VLHGIFITIAIQMHLLMEPGLCSLLKIKATLYNETITGPLMVLGFGNPFCPGLTTSCNLASPLNFQKSKLEYTFNSKLNTVTPGLHSVRTNFGLGLGGGIGSFDCANIAGNFGLTPEIFNVVAQGMTNYAPEFVNLPVTFVQANQPVSYSTAAIDPDGDSLVYSLRPVNTNATYASGFTYLNPITANPALALNSRTGAITFTPTAFNFTVSTGAKENKYVVGLQVDEYRRINGLTTKIGTIQRNLLINVVSTGNQAPVLTAFHNNASVAPNTIIDVTPGTTVSMNFGASDPDMLDVVSPGTNANTVLLGSNWIVTLGLNPNGGQLTWTPTAAQVREEPYFFNVSAFDNACPYPASRTQTYGFRVRNVSGIKPNRTVNPLFTVYPNPATDQVTFRFLNSKPAKAHLYILNQLGQQLDEIAVPDGQEEGLEIHWEKANRFPAGHYLARMVAEDGSSKTLKFVKLR